MNKAEAAAILAKETMGWQAPSGYLPGWWRDEYDQAAERVDQWQPFDHLQQAKRVQHRLLVRHPGWTWKVRLEVDHTTYHGRAEIEREEDERIVAHCDGSDFSCAEATAICLAALQATMGQEVQIGDL
jgi:hypothetical protein